MPRGRKPTPTKLKLVRNNPGKRKINKREPKPKKPLPLSPPAVLNKLAKKEWQRLAPELSKMGLLTAFDVALFAGYCAAYSTWYEAQGELEKHGRIVRAANGTPIPSPWLAVANKANEQVVKMGSEMGLTPSARTRLELPTDAAGVGDDDWGDLDL